MNISFFYKAGAVLGVLILFAFVFIGHAEESANSGKNLFADYDQDGLSNDEEAAYGTDPHNADTDSDGYSDYVEVSSGYDPKKPAPGDRLVKATEPIVVPEISVEGEKNLTEEVSAKLAGVMQASAAEGKMLTLADIDKVVSDSVESSVQAPKMPEVDVKRIKIKDESYKKLSNDERKEKIQEDAKRYMSAVMYVFAVQFPSVASEDGNASTAAAGNTITKLLLAFSMGDEKEINTFVEAGSKATEQLYDIEVPETLLDLHIRGIQFSLYAQEMKKSVKISAGDPLESISNFSLAQGLIASGSEFVTDAQSRLAELGVDSVPLSIGVSE